LSIDAFSTTLRGNREKSKGEEDDSEEDVEEEEEEEESEEEEEAPAAPEGAGTSRAERKAQKKKSKVEEKTEEKDEEEDDEDEDLVNPNRAGIKNLNISDLSAPRELSRRERYVCQYISSGSHINCLPHVQGAEGEAGGQGEVLEGKRSWIR
jgi:predicted  nucleic acid-binding Zn-ribbon protein